MLAFHAEDRGFNSPWEYQLKVQMKKIEVGDKVRTVPKTKNGRACDAVVIHVAECDPNNPVEDHGSVEVRFANKRPHTWSQEVEHYTHFNWELHLRITKKLGTS